MLLFIATFALPRGKFASLNVEAQTWQLAAKRALMQIPCADNVGTIIPPTAPLIAMTQRRSVVGSCNRCSAVLFADELYRQRGGSVYCEECR